MRVKEVMWGIMKINLDTIILNEFSGNQPFMDNGVPITIGMIMANAYMLPEGGRSPEGQEARRRKKRALVLRKGGTVDMDSKERAFILEQARQLLPIFMCAIYDATDPEITEEPISKS